jgi:hypothetical protein
VKRARHETQTEKDEASTLGEGIKGEDEVKGGFAGKDGKKGCYLEWVGSMSTE